VNVFVFEDGQNFRKQSLEEAIVLLQRWIHWAILSRRLTIVVVAWC